MLKCKDISIEATEYLERSMPLRRRLLVWYHLLICVHCRRYIRQLRVIIAMLPRLLSRPTLSEDDVQAQVERLSQIQS
jgi:hypothetical protein